MLTRAAGTPSTQPAPESQPFAGSDVWKFAYSAFGETVGDAGLSPPATNQPTRYGYAGGWGYEAGHLTLGGANPDLGAIELHHVGARWYQPDVGRFVQRDPIGIGGGTNVYAYVGNSPLVGIDPSGRQPPKPTDGLPPNIQDLLDWIFAGGLGSAGGAIGAGVAGGTVVGTTAAGAATAGVTAAGVAGAGVGAAAGVLVWFGGKAIVIQGCDLISTWDELDASEGANRRFRAAHPEAFPPPPDPRRTPGPQTGAGVMSGPGFQPRQM